MGNGVIYVDECFPIGLSIYRIGVEEWNEEYPFFRVISCSKFKRRGDDAP